jgi:hypothetical protein
MGNGQWALVLRVLGENRREAKVLVISYWELVLSVLGENRREAELLVIDHCPLPDAHCPIPIAQFPIPTFNQVHFPK